MMPGVDDVLYSFHECMKRALSRPCPSSEQAHAKLEKLAGEREQASYDTPAARGFLAEAGSVWRQRGLSALLYAGWDSFVEVVVGLVPAGCLWHPAQSLGDAPDMRVHRELRPSIVQSLPEENLKGGWLWL